MIFIPPRNYDDIIDLPRPEVHCRPCMSAMGRAAQFAPFAALSGFEEEMDETARLTDEGFEMTEEDMAHLNARLREIMDEIHLRPEVRMTCFQPDEKKSGGAYVSVAGRVRRIDEVNQQIVFTDGRSIPMERVLRIDHVRTESTA